MDGGRWKLESMLSTIRVGTQRTAERAITPQLRHLLALREDRFLTISFQRPHTPLHLPTYISLDTITCSHSITLQSLTSPLLPLSAAMASKASEYTAFLPNSLLTAVNSKAFVPFLLGADPTDGVSLAAISATQHQRHAELLALPSSTSLSSVLAFFRQWDITAVAIVEEGRIQKKKQFAPKDVLGVFSMQDLTRPLIYHPIFDRAPAALLPALAASSRPSSPATSPASPLTEAEFRDALQHLDVWQRPVTDFFSCNPSNRSAWFLRGSHHVRDAAKALGSGLRHVLVTEGDDINSAAPTTIHMLSAGDLARFIYTALPQDTSEHSSLPAPLSHLLSSPVAAHVTTKSIVTFQEHELTISAFRRLASPPSHSGHSPTAASSAPASAVSSLGAVPIVNSSHMVIDNLSATDLRLLTPATFHLILEPLSTFLKTLRSAHSGAEAPVAGKEKGAKAMRPAFAATVDGKASMQIMLEKTVNLGISRIWVVDDEAKPVGVIALSDVFRMIVQLDLDERRS